MKEGKEKKNFGSSIIKTKIGDHGESYTYLPNLHIGKRFFPFILSSLASSFVNPSGAS